MVTGIVTSIRIHTFDEGYRLDVLRLIRGDPLGSDWNTDVRQLTASVDRVRSDGGQSTYDEEVGE